MNENGLNYIDLFAGAGGLSEGFIQSGYRPVAHVEMNEHAAKTIETRCNYRWSSVPGIFFGGKSTEQSYDCSDGR